MQAQLWNVNGLSVELRMDRRNLSRKLEGLEPDKVEQVGKRTFRYYYMARVVEHVYKAKKNNGMPETALDAARREKLEFELEVARGDYVPTDEAIALYVGTIVEAKNRLRGVAAKLAPRLVGEPEASTIQDKVATEIDDALESLADFDASDKLGMATSAEVERQRVGR